jgi:hypothetical protein
VIKSTNTPVCSLAVHPNHQSVHVHYSRYLGNCDDQAAFLPGASDFMLCIEPNHLTVIIDNMCSSFFQHTPDRPELRRIDWATSHTHLEAEIPCNPELYN